MKNIVVIDNYDSFTYNLVHTIQDIVGNSITVLRNDVFTLTDLEEFDVIFLSPGPGIPSEAGLMSSVIKEYYKRKSIMGICLGHQAIGESFGASLHNLEEVFHGMMTPMHVNEEYSSKLFENIPANFEGGRYHSWVINKDTIPDSLKVICKDASEEIMAIEHKDYPVIGVQFHPESILTPYGNDIINNFLKFYC